MELILTIEESNWGLWKSSLKVRESILGLWALGVDRSLIGDFESRHYVGLKESILDL